MITREFSSDAVCARYLDEIDPSPWRHGRCVTFVFELDGEYWSFTASVHHDAGIGIQIDDPTVTATKVHQVERTVKVWEPVP